MIQLFFPEVQLPSGLTFGTPRQDPRSFVANPKAVAAQTFASPTAFNTYLSSGIWQKAAPIFAPQYDMDGGLDFDFKLGGDLNWLAFPWAVTTELASAGTLVWLEKVADGQDVRHVRLYCSTEQADKDNRWLSEILAPLSA